MKPMNRQMKDTRDLAAVGIGTMIVFIATVLVAAIAAGVLIDMSGKLQTRSSATGEQATEEVSSNLRFDGIIGQRPDVDTANLGDLNITVSLAAGAQTVDLSEMRITLTTGTTQTVYSHDDDPDPGTEEFNATVLRDSDSGFTSASPVMNQGDLVRLDIDLTQDDMEIGPRDDLTITLSPEVGISAETEVTAPQSFGTKTIVVLS